MNKKLILRKAHRYIGLLLALQLLAWTLGGIWFTWNDIDNIHGDHLRNTEIKENSQQLISPQITFDNIDDFKRLRNLKVTTFIDQPAYNISYISQDQSHKTQLVNAVNGTLIAEVNQQQAIAIAKSHASFKADIDNAELITQTGKHHEYRGKPLPAWAITFDYPSSPTFYISAQLGTMVSVRHNAWRIFDFLWMLHTMDYEGRDDFGNWLIKIFSIIALITAISGIVLFVISSKKRRKK